MKGVMTRSIAAMAVMVIGLSIGACGGSSSSRPSAPEPAPVTDSTQPSPLSRGTGSNSAQATAIPIQSCNAAEPQFVPTFTLPARDQGTQCLGSCWAYVVAGAYEQNYAFKSGQIIDVSERNILECSGAGDCNGGAFDFQFFNSRGTTLEADYPYPQNPTCNGPTPLTASQRGFVNASTPIPPVHAIKAAVCAHGAVAAGVVETAAFRNHRGSGVFSETTDEPLHHAVVIVGWNDTTGAWRVRNSRTEWGEQGYGWVSYGSNRIGHSATWVEANAPPRPALPCAPGSLEVSGGTSASTPCEGPVR
jgi:C1A family cysteine protease